MYRYASSRLTSLKARQANRVLTRFSSSAAVAATKPSGGLFSWITGKTSSAVTPLDFPLNDVNLSPPLLDYVEPAKTQITILANGLKVASEASVNPAASIGLYVDCGSIYETPASYGATHLLERMAFKSTLNRSHLRVVREIEAIGGNVTASASREHMIYTYDALKTYVPQMVEMLVDSVRNPAFLDWEVKEQLEKVKAEISEYSKNPQHLLLEAVHSAGYAGPYGNSLMATEATINRLNSKGLEDFVAENYTAPRMVLAASGVEHEELLKVAEPLLSDLPKAATAGEPKPVYVGGDYRRHAESEMTHFALAFEVPGGWMSEKDSMTLTVLQMLMGGGGSFSAGGPGKGMYSRLYLRVLNKYPQMHAFSAFSSIYNNTGLFGIQATTTPDFGPQAVDVAVQELIAVANPAEVDQVQLNRAKQATKSAILMNLESRMVASEDIGRQLLTYGERKPVEHFLKAIDAVSAKDIASIVQKLISSPLTMASYGDVLSLPSYDAVSSRFHSK
ncbi:mitochondrial-processing peptidase subunit alpha [Capsicum annuum]|uniref:mitochondrial-processing peptidase subunit alpha n=1 Tax=Capsicum annuum TaxID=4072 RepID=UPI001FB15763|nr:mitochondrial-processing peptidase subunit alpha [Capsicum annuum]